MPTRSYLSQSELPVTFGLGDDETIERATVHWPDGTQQKIHELKIDAMQTIQQEASPPATGGEKPTT